MPTHRNAAPSSRRRGHADREERREANVALGKALRTIRLVRGFYVTLAVVSFVLLVLFAIALQVVETTAEQNLLLILVAVQAIQTLFLAVGAWMIGKEPYSWSLVLSLYLTIALALRLGLNAGSDEIARGILIPLILTLASWGATAILGPVKRLLAEHGDTVAGQLLQGKRPRARPGSEARGRASRRALRHERESGPSVALYALGGVVIVLGLFIGFVFWQRADQAESRDRRIVRAMERAEQQREDMEQRKLAFEPVIARFERAWRANDRAGITAMMVDEAVLRESELGKFEKSFERYDFDFGAPLPPIDDRRETWPRLERLGPGDPILVKSYFRVTRNDNGQRVKLRSNWSWQDDRWVLVELALRKTSRD
jgi:hypothetical protein